MNSTAANQPAPMHPFFYSHAALPVLGLALLPAGCAHPNMNVPLPLLELRTFFP